LFEIKGLTVVFGGLVAVNDVSFEVRKNEIVSLIGPNGAGKTTIFNAITGFCHVSKGHVVFKGEDLTGFKPHEVAKKGITRTFQITHIFPELTVLDNVITAANQQFKSGFWDVLINSALVKNEEKVFREKALEILDVCGLMDRRDIEAKYIPYGEGRLLEIAIALATNPELLLLDEPACSLNPNETNVLMTLIKKLRDIGYTILLVEHDMKLVMNISDRIEVINFGLQIAKGTPKEIAENEKVIEAYLGSKNLREKRYRRPDAVTKPVADRSAAAVSA